jgi:hypothetical protein
VAVLNKTVGQPEIGKANQMRRTSLQVIPASAGGEAWKSCAKKLPDGLDFFGQKSSPFTSV